MCSADAYCTLGREGGGPNKHMHTEKILCLIFLVPPYYINFISSLVIRFRSCISSRNITKVTRCCHGTPSGCHSSCCPVYLINKVPARLLHCEVTSFALKLITISGKGSRMPWRYYRFGYHNKMNTEIKQVARIFGIPSTYKDFVYTIL